MSACKKQSTQEKDWQEIWQNVNSLWVKALMVIFLASLDFSVSYKFPTMAHIILMVKRAKAKL